MADTITRNVVQQVEGLSEEQLVPLFSKIKEAVLDFLAAGYVARTEERVLNVERVLQQQGKAPLLGQHRTGSAGQSALFNGFLGHYLDYDDTNSAVRGHVSAVLLPVLLALASERPCTGKRFLTAYGVGEEMMARLGRSIGRTHYEKGFHNTATLGVLAGAAAGAFLWKLDAEQMAHALGLAATQSSGLRIHFGTETKPLQVGLAAEKAVEAVQLAAAGVRTSPDVLDGPLGFFSVYGDGPEKAEPVLCAPWGEKWNLLKEGLWFKRCTFCSGAMHTMDAVTELKKNPEIRKENIKAVELIFPPGGDAALIQHHPRTGEEGRFSAEYVAAVGLWDPAYNPERFSPEPIPQDILHFMTRIVRKHDPSIQPASDAQPKGRFTIARVTLHSGRSFEKRIDIPKGAPQNPLAEAERKEKLFRSCGEKKAEQFLHAVGGLEKAPSLTDFLDIL